MKYAVIHQGQCGSAFDYQIQSDGQTLYANRVVDGKQLIIHIQLIGDFETNTPSDQQHDALRAVLLQLKLTYPDIRIGGHRQLRGSNTTCPGKRFPLKELIKWAENELIEARDRQLEEWVERQYR